MQTQPPQITHFLSDIENTNPDTHKIITAVCDLFEKYQPGIQQDVKYGGIVFLVDDTLTAGVFPYTSHVSIEFSNGAKMDDPYQVLEGKGNLCRDIKLTPLNDLKEKHVADYIQRCLQQQ
ncbi:DUF1801 domain-containing protein [Candidatus Woesebacteria bacterium]|nr:DUF1801 domain-containing protein [Candidatus Woesebacteria bacterium]MCD8507425.1 DUF1801 domain-containing protein [Candidatus Woesebacteria bacterium]MCD8526883.1 DUF1801 domain-containing protein [Candidatus Woesebacteria bacterium]MCD8545779.1 DUF1801 domain-containing protein [Candidatus Woesebacteria bacterium]